MCCRLIVAWLDSITTEEKWRTVLKGSPASKEVTRFTVMVNGDILGVGEDRGHHTDPDSLYVRGWVFRLDSSGNILWS